MIRFYFIRFFDYWYDKNRIKTSCNIFSVDFTPTDTNDILDKHLMERTWDKMFGLIKKILMRLLTGLVNLIIQSAFC